MEENNDRSGRATVRRSVDGETAPDVAMTQPNQPDITRVLQRAAAGDRDAGAELLPLVYDELRRLAKSQMANLPPGQTLQPTALVHEAYLSVVGGEKSGWEGRRHFFGAAARAMRNILVDQSRRRASRKRGGDRRRVELRDSDYCFEVSDIDLIALDEALTDLEREDPRKVQLVHLRFFAGFSNEESADVLGVSIGTVKRDWAYAKRWLYVRLHEAGNPSENKNR